MIQNERSITDLRLDCGIWGRLLLPLLLMVGLKSLQFSRAGSQERRLGVKQGKSRINWNVPRLNGVRKYKQEISSVSYCLLLLMEKLAKKSVPILIHYLDYISFNYLQLSMACD